MTTISIDTTMFGMTVTGGTIYYSAGKKGLKMLNLSDKSVSDIINSDMSGVLLRSYIWRQALLHTLSHTYRDML
jgi:hypothetical protein